MTRTVEPSQLGDLLAGLDYPVTKRQARGMLSEVRLACADGEESLSQVLDRCGSEFYPSADDLRSEIVSNAAVEAVGRPGQAESER